jgi:hypothetical protein
MLLDSFDQRRRLVCWLSSSGSAAAQRSKNAYLDAELRLLRPLPLSLGSAAGGHQPARTVPAKAQVQPATLGEGRSGRRHGKAGWGDGHGPRTLGGHRRPRPMRTLHRPRLWVVTVGVLLQAAAHCDDARQSQVLGDAASFVEQALRLLEVAGSGSLQQRAGACDA